MAPELPLFLGKSAFLSSALVVLAEVSRLEEEMGASSHRRVLGGGGESWGNWGKTMEVRAQQNKV